VVVITLLRRSVPARDARRRAVTARRALTFDAFGADLERDLDLAYDSHGLDEGLLAEEVLDPANPCRCRRRIGAAVSRGRVDAVMAAGA